MRNNSNGFTLAELMITVAIIGILAAIAVPAYSNYVLRANRTVAKTVIMKIAGHQEAFFNDRKTYATALNQMSDYPAAVAYVQSDGKLTSASTSTSIYSVTLGAYTADTVRLCTVTGTPTATQYAIKVTPLNRQLNDTTCGSLCYGSVGDKGSSAASGANTSDCWRR